MRQDESLARYRFNNYGNKYLTIGSDETVSIFKIL